MTETQTTEVEPILAQGRIALKSATSLADVQKAMVEPYRADTARTEMMPFPEVPAPVVLTDEVREALARLKDVFAVVQPESRRTLTEEERAAVHDERQVLKTIMGLLEGRDEALKTLIRHHMDTDAEERGVAVPQAVVDPATGQVIVEATDRSADGHYILCAPQKPERCPIPGTNQEWSREYRQGAISTDPLVIEDMLAAGEITRAEYLAMTREVRVFDPNKAMDMAVHKPEYAEGILRAIKAMTKVGKPSVSLFVRKAR